MSIEKKIDYENKLENMNLDIFESLKETDSHWYTHPSNFKKYKILYYHYEGGIQEIYIENEK